MMSLTPDEARTALNDIAKTENRTAASRHARQAAPHLILWGVIWAIGYAVMALRPEWDAVWAVLIVAGVVGGVLIGMRQAGAEGGKGDGWRYGASLGVLGAFALGLYLVAPPQTGNQVGAFFPLLVGCCYALTGVWSKGWRMLPLGLAIIAATVAGFIWLPQYFSLFMAVIGGGGLVLGGVWMRGV